MLIRPWRRMSSGAAFWRLCGPLSGITFDIGGGGGFLVCAGPGELAVDRPVNGSPRQASFVNNVADSGAGCAFAEE